MLNFLTAELDLRRRQFMPVARAAVVAVPAPDTGGRAAGADTAQATGPCRNPGHAAKVGWEGLPPAPPTVSA